MHFQGILILFVNFKKKTMEQISEYDELSKSDPCQAYAKAVVIAGKQAENLDQIFHENFGWILYRYLKVQIYVMPSVEIRKLLRDYIKLKNKRPSLLHSKMLEFALNFAKENSDFRFPGFLKLWGMSNFRDEDLNYDNNDYVAAEPSIIIKTCAQLSKTDTLLIEELSEGTGLDISLIVDMQRKQYYNDLYRLHRNNQISEFWEEIDSYINKYKIYAATRWHSKILKLAIKKVEVKYAQSFINMVCSWDDAGILADDWLIETDKDGNKIPLFPVQFVKACYEIIQQPQFPLNINLLKSLAKLYDKIEKKKIGDDDTARQQVTISTLIGNIQH